ncbi:MAG: phosphoglycerate kinase [Candidatus Woesearchaeota archaeon]
MRSVKEADVAGKRVLVRAGFDVPLKNGRVADDARLRAALPTIRLLRKRGARVILLSHLDRPDGKVVDELRLAPVAKALSKLLKFPVQYEPDCIGSDVEERVREMHEGDVLLLENLRFYPEEEANNRGFAQKLASIADIYVNDAFSVCHRAHASVSAIAEFLPAYAGLSLEEEVNALAALLKNPKHPFIAVMGGAKVSDKIGVIGNLLEKVDAILVGGAIMFTFYKALGYEIGKSRYEPDKVNLAKMLLKKGRRKIVLPADVVVAGTEKKDAKVCAADKMLKNSIGLDIGPETRAIYSEIIKKSKTVFWNGPMGMFEKKPFDKGTVSIAKAIAQCRGTTVVGGGDSVAAVEKANLTGKFTFVCTGGGASLEFLEGKKLPGLTALNDNILN